MGKRNVLSNYFVVEYCMGDPFVTFYWDKTKGDFRNIEEVSFDNLFKKEEDARNVLINLPMSIVNDCIVKPFEYPDYLLYRQDSLL